MAFPPSHPLFDRLFLGTDGFVWIRNTRSLEDAGPNHWSVFDTAGVWISDVVTPGDLSIQEFGSDYVLGIWRDEYDLEYLRIYGIVKGAH